MITNDEFVPKGLVSLWGLGIPFSAEKIIVQPRFGDAVIITSFDKWPQIEILPISKAQIPETMLICYIYEYPGHWPSG